jgi:hypothetical protein
LGNLDYTAVSRERKRVRENAQKEKSLRAALDDIESSLIA